MEYTNVEITYVDKTVAAYKLSLPANKGNFEGLFNREPEWMGFDTSIGMLVINKEEIRSVLFFNGDLWKR